MTSNIKKNRFKFVTDDEMYSLEVDIIGANTPDVTLNSININAYGGDLFKRSGDSIEFGELTLKVRLDEEMSNYQLFLDWIYSIHNPVTSKQEELPKQASLLIYAVNGKVLKEYYFWNIRPINLSGIEFLTNTDEDFELFDITFDFDRFELRSVD